MLQSQGGNRLRHTARLIEIDRLRTPLGHGAEAAAPRAQVAQHHEGGRFVLPALTDIRALRALAHRVQIQGPRQLLEPVVVLAHRSLRLQPGGFRSALARRRIDLHQV
jgi:hypothetical protein